MSEENYIEQQRVRLPAVINNTCVSDSVSCRGKAETAPDVLVTEFGTILYISRDGNDRQKNIALMMNIKVHLMT